jgi:uncharacterized protein YbjT (DUF2867 family)
MGYSRAVFISGGTGYVGRRLLPELLRRGHAVRALVRPGSEDKVCGQCAVTTGDVLNSQTFSMAVAPVDTFVHLVGVPRPAPWKGKAFRALDLPRFGLLSRRRTRLQSGTSSISAARSRRLL